MAKNISEQDIRKAITEVKHSAIDCTLIELGAECEIKETIMTSKEREAFLDKEQKNWKGNI